MVINTPIGKIEASAETMEQLKFVFVCASLRCSQDAKDKNLTDKARNAAKILSRRYHDSRIEIVKQLTR